MAILDLKTPQHWPTWMERLTAWVNRPFTVTLETTYRRPWESLQKYLQEICYREYFWLSIPVGWPKAEWSNRIKERCQAFNSFSSGR